MYRCEVLCVICHIMYALKIHDHKRSLLRTADYLIIDTRRYKGTKVLYMQSADPLWNASDTSAGRT